MRHLAPAAFAVLLCTATARAGSHTWVVNEAFSNADGTIQFVELKECCGNTNEIFVGNKSVTSSAQGVIHTFGSNLPSGTTAEAHILLATAGFAALPGAPTPDHVIDANSIDLSADTLQWHIYGPSILSYAAGELPLDGVSSISQDGTTGPNSPTNFADESGSVNLPCLAADTDGNLEVNVDDLVKVITEWGTADPDADVNDDNIVNVNDLVAVITQWGDC